MVDPNSQPAAHGTAFDPDKPDGQPRRKLDTSRAAELFGWRSRTNFEDGLRSTVDWYLANREIEPARAVAARA